MSDPALALQKAIVAALRTAAGNIVFDRPSDVFPRITLGEGQALPDIADCRRGTETFLDIHVWSREPGFVEAKTIAEKVRDALDDEILTLEGHVMDLMTFDSAQYLRDPDGVTSHAALTFRILTQPLS